MEFNNIGKSNLKRILSYTLSTIIGCVFLISSLSKLFILQNFSQTVSNFIPFLGVYSYLVAVLAISFEFILGVLLLFRYKVELVSKLLSLLLTFFIGLLISDIILGNSTSCNCFGGLGITFSNFTQMIIDLALLSGLLLTIYLSDKSSNDISKFSAIPSFLFIFLIGTSLLILAYRSDKKAEMANFYKVGNFIDVKFEKNKKNVLFLMSFTDFNCPLCYDDFVALADSLERNVYDSINVHYFFKSNLADMDILDSLRFERWKEVNNITKHLTLLDDKVYEENKINKSSVFVTDEKENIFFQGEFPINESNRKRVLQFLTE